MTVRIFGIRHHGPGSARALVRALEEMKPDLILVEGPPEADGLVAVAASDDLVPPVALLAYNSDHSSFWPFAVFSPEWQAIRYAVTHDVPLRFCDLPAANRFGAAEKAAAERAVAEKAAAENAAAEEATEEKAAQEEAAAEGSGAGNGGAASGVEAAVPSQAGAGLSDVDGLPQADAEGAAQGDVVVVQERTDPIGALAQAAGYDDAERWWEDVIEHRLDGPGSAGASRQECSQSPFEAVAEAMAAVRAVQPAIDEDLIREAYMRQVLRKELKAGYANIAIVCGAWHVPALQEPMPSATHDSQLLKGLPKVAVEATWVPWTHGRLASWTGYGAGVTAPGWYHHLFTTADRPIERWLVQVAGVLRAEDLPVSSAHVIEATRLADTLSVLRGRPLPGLSEVTEATRAVLCDGDDVRLELVQRKVVVGEALGEVPDETPSVPLAKDVAATQKRLRMAPKALIEEVKLDLRKPNHLESSHLLHRLRLLGVEWGKPNDRGSGKGTFWEHWQTEWKPEFAVDLIAASGYGTTLVSAAAAKVTERCAQAELPELTELLEACLLAALDEAQPAVLKSLGERAALDTDVVHLMSAVPALARTLRYGDVRGTKVDSLIPVLNGLITRAQLGLPQAVSSVDEEAAKELVAALDATHSAIRLLNERLDVMPGWLETLRGLVDRDDLAGLLAGRFTRLLRDENGLDSDEVELRLARALTVGVPAATAASFVEGFLAGGGVLLVHDEALLGLIDRWLVGLPADTFGNVLPLLRRTFSAFAGPERRSIGERVRHLGAPGGAQRLSDQDDLAGLDLERVARVVPTLRLLLEAR